ncbi:MAG: PCMD domain-containing protein, partial [Bacteroidia bacterium]|nr:PCMD domain-containing protein [Bacteroidia bacterium]
MMRSIIFLILLFLAVLMQGCRWKYEFDPIPTPSKEFISNSDWYLNRDFEVWDSVAGKQYLQPRGWATGNEGTALIRSEGNCTRTTDAQSGQYAVKLESLRNSFGNSVASATTFLGQFNFNLNQALNPVTARDMTVLGLPIEASLANKKFDKFIGYYKYTPGQPYVRLNNPTNLFA